MSKERFISSKKTRKIVIYFSWRRSHYSFCWIEFLKDNSLSLGFPSKAFRFTEYGSAVNRSGYFTEHTIIITRGNINISEAKSPHITFHPPRIAQNMGIVHIKADNGIVDEYELDWFPVKKFGPLLYAFTGDIEALDEVNRKISRYQIVSVPSNVRCLRMELVIYPRSPNFSIVHMPGAIGNIHGGCPAYVVSCYFYGHDRVNPAFYITTDLNVP